MSNLGLIIEERSRDIGDFLVGRLLPFRKKRMVGPFCFLDHMGPVEFTGSEKMDIGAHPHIGLSTLTYLFEGSVMHRDSLGTKQLIKPGSVNWMTAGKGIVHSERSPKERYDQVMRMHGLQIWVALPKHLEDMEPQFHHTVAQELPQWEEEGAQFTLIAGKAYDKVSPVPVHSSLFLVEVQTTKTKISLNREGLNGELALYILKGSITACGESVGAGNLLVAKDVLDCNYEISEEAQVFLLGGEAFPEPRHLAWNFVSSDLNKLKAAARDWELRKFPVIPDDDSYIPLPPSMRST